uniref:Ribosomal protein L18 n=1 Tax=Nitzschia sp. PL1-4 TaxID=2083272 RepID=A0A2Z5ZAQ7_9STRA|nr:ribosomal protein L18 [Nitzschia sp. PL1-4]
MQKKYSNKFKPKRIRLSIYRSKKNLYINIINDNLAKVLMTYSTLNLPIKFHRYYSSYNSSRLLGRKIANYCLKNNINKIVLDRNFYSYHGCIKILADEMRINSLIF